MMGIRPKKTKLNLKNINLPYFGYYWVLSEILPIGLIPVPDTCVTLSGPT